MILPCKVVCLVLVLISHLAEKPPTLETRDIEYGIITHVGTATATETG